MQMQQLMTKLRINQMQDALIVVDLQNDFCPGGKLAVPEGDEIIPIINELLVVKWKVKVASRDWHPEKHCSFKEEGGLWPVHCIQNTEGADYHSDLLVEKIDKEFLKGVNLDKDEYSAFSRGMGEFLKTRGIKRIFITGLAANFCVYNTALDAVREKFGTYVVKDATRGIDISKGDTERAFREMEEKGIKLINSEEII